VRGYPATGSVSGEEDVHTGSKAKRDASGAHSPESSNGSNSGSSEELEPFITGIPTQSTVRMPVVREKVALPAAASHGGVSHLV